MKPTWIFDKPGRPERLLVLAALLAVAVMVLVLLVRVNALSDRANQVDNADPAAVPTAGERGLATPGPTDLPQADGGLSSGQPDEAITPAPDGGLQTDPTQQAFPSVGDPTPIALRAVRNWLAGRYSDLEGDLMPGVLEEVTANRPPAGTAINAAAHLSAPGPTESVVTVPTNKGDLNVTLIVVNSKRWMVESMGWSSTAFRTLNPDGSLG